MLPAVLGGARACRLIGMAVARVHITEFVVLFFGQRPFFSAITCASLIANSIAVPTVKSQYFFVLQFTQKQEEQKVTDDSDLVKLPPRPTPAYAMNFNYH